MKRTPLRRRSARKRITDNELTEARAEVLLRDGWQCQLASQGNCSQPLEVHHKLPRSRGGKHDLDNLVTLCSKHHRWVHANPLLAYELDMLRRAAS